jgi:DNA-binding NarL/FixJ family response regulator
MKPDVMIVDLMLADMSGLGRGAAGAEEIALTASVVLSMYGNDCYVVERCRRALVHMY